MRCIINPLHSNVESVIDDDDGKRFKCNVCSYETNHRGNINKHVRVHSNQKPFECDKCGKTFTDASNLTSHLTIHKKHSTTVFSCRYCDQTFSRKGNLEQHLEHMHSGNFKCSNCNECFQDKEELKSHLKSRHLEEGQKLYKCNECEYSTTRSKDLISHKKIPNASVNLHRVGT